MKLNPDIQVVYIEIFEDLSTCDITNSHLEKFITQCNSCPLSPSEKLRQLAILIEENNGIDIPYDDWKIVYNIYQRAFLLDPSHYLSYLSCGVAAHYFSNVETEEGARQEILSDGERALLVAMKLCPEDSDIYYTLGIIYYFSSTEAFENAKKYFAKTLEKDPKHNMARMYLGHCYTDEKKWKESLDQYLLVDQNRLAEEWPSWRVIKLKELIGYCYAKLGQHEKAKVIFQEVLSFYDIRDKDTWHDFAVFPDELVEVVSQDKQSELYCETKNVLQRLEIQIYDEKFSE